jgi:hypothetical protein
MLGEGLSVLRRDFLSVCCAPQMISSGPGVDLKAAGLIKGKVSFVTPQTRE